eukprot:scaffold145_cov268-Prasinococcus_capsulatus_cf.AAC.1
MPCGARTAWWRRKRRKRTAHWTRACSARAAATSRCRLAPTARGRRRTANTSPTRACARRSSRRKFARKLRARFAPGLLLGGVATSGQRGPCNLGADAPPCVRCCDSSPASMTGTTPRRSRASSTTARMRSIRAPYAPLLLLLGTRSYRRCSLQQRAL